MGVFYFVCTGVFAFSSAVVGVPVFACVCEMHVFNNSPLLISPITTTTSPTLYVFPRSTLHHGLDDSLVTLHAP